MGHADGSSATQVKDHAVSGKVSIEVFRDAHPINYTNTVLNPGDIFWTEKPTVIVPSGRA